MSVKEWSRISRMHVCVGMIRYVPGGVFLTEYVLLLALLVIKVFAFTYGHHVFCMNSMGAFLLAAGTKGERRDSRCVFAILYLLAFM